MTLSLDPKVRACAPRRAGHGIQGRRSPLAAATFETACIAFSSGRGDGFYPSYWGYDAAGQRVALVTDCRVLGERGQKAE